MRPVTLTIDDRSVGDAFDSRHGHIETLLRVWNLLETRALYRQLRRLQPDQQPLRARPMALGNS